MYQHYTSSSHGIRATFCSYFSQNCSKNWNLKLQFSSFVDSPSYHRLQFLLGNLLFNTLHSKVYPMQIVQVVACTYNVFGYYMYFHGTNPFKWILIVCWQTIEHYKNCSFNVTRRSNAEKCLLVHLMQN